jgi:hypothetical protein
VLSPETEDRDEVEATTERKKKIKGNIKKVISRELSLRGRNDNESCLDAVSAFRNNLL